MYASHTNTALQLVNGYSGGVPFQHYIREYFSRNKKHGSRDRKYISALCYQFFRFGRSLDQLDPESRMDAAVQSHKTLTDSSSSQSYLLHSPSFTEALRELNAAISSFEKEKIFSFNHSLSSGIEKEWFCISHLIQPYVFLRLRPGEKEKVLAQLQLADVSYKIIDEFSIALNPATKLDEYLHINRQVVVQDLSSQRTARFFPGTDHLPKQPHVWDCCAASGGKSMLAYDLLGSIQLTVSDIRSSIITNLQKRFAEAGIARYSSFVADISVGAEVHKKKYDLVLADLPCSGSGTWGRAPENLIHFRDEEVNRYSELQKRILSNVQNSVKPGGYLLYITCSVFRAENEDVVEHFITQHPHFEIQKQSVIIGYNERADTMFASLLKRQ